MKVKQAKEKTIVSFRINTIKGTKADETSEFLEFVNNLCAEFIPHRTFRYCFLDRESDDSIWNVTFDKIFFDLVKQRGWIK